MTEEEYAQRLRVFADEKRGKVDSHPARFDWREKIPGSVTPVRDQGRCGSCWAFAAIACVESRIIIQGGERLDLSEQYAVSCDARNHGCCGGYSFVFDFFRDHGLVLEKEFPYRDFYRELCGGSPCRPALSRVGGVTLTGWYTVDGGDLVQVKQAVLEGPVWGAFDVYEDFFDYWDWSDGSDLRKWPDKVYYPRGGQPDGGHAIAIFGWDDKLRCWLCKNSWGSGGPFGDGTLRFRYGASNFPRLECAAPEVRVPVRFLRGNLSSGDTTVDLADAILLLEYLYADAPPPGCVASADVNGDDALDLSDAIYLLNYLYVDGAAPGQPFPECGPAPEDTRLPCEEAGPCDVRP